jgi:tripartite ATP-independent transporter DctM subunit
MIWLIILGGFIVTAWTAMPLGVGLGLTGLVILHFLGGGSEGLAVSAVWDVFNGFTMSAAPLFIFMGAILLYGGLSKLVYGAIAPWFEPIPGKLLHSNIAVCTVFGAISGTSMATAAAVGSIAYPELKSRGYQPDVVVATLAAGGTLGLLIPPSLSLLIYGALQEVSIGRLFLAGILPGLMMALLFMAAIYVTVKRRPTLVPQMEEVLSLRAKLVGLARIWPIAILILAVLGTIYLGIATPTEAAALGVATSIVTGFIWGELTIPKLFKAFYSSAITFGSIGLIILGALILAQAISVLGVPQNLMEHIQSMHLSRYVVFLLVILFYVILGCFFDGISLMLMTLPIVFPVMTGLGFNAIWLGVIITLLIEIGQLTPPVGVNLFVLVGISEGQVGLGSAAKASLPYWLLLLLGIALLTFFPQIALLLPNLVY